MYQQKVRTQIRGLFTGAFWSESTLFGKWRDSNEETKHYKMFYRQKSIDELINWIKYYIDLCGNDAQYSNKTIESNKALQTGKCMHKLLWSNWQMSPRQKLRMICSFHDNFNFTLELWCCPHLDCLFRTIPVSVGTIGLRSRKLGVYILNTRCLS